MTPYHPLTSTGTPPDDAAMIWPWPHNWASPVTRRPEWSTVVLTSATGAEQRQALREYPREQVTYEHLLEGDDAALAFTLLRVWKGRDWLVPDWTEATKTTAPAGAVLSLLRYSVPAGLALLGTEVVTLLDAEGTLEVAPSGSWPAGTTLVPLRLASLDADQTVSHVTGAVSRISPTFLFSEPMQVDETVLTRNGEVSRWGVDPSGAPTSDARAHMLPRAHNFASPGSTQVSRELDELDPGVGLRHTRPRHDISTSQWSYNTLLESDRDILAFRALLQQHRGSAIGMYASPPGADLEVVEIVGGLATVPGSQFWGSAPPAIDLLTPRGWECRKVASVSPAGVQLTNTGVQALPGEVVTARSVHRVRLLGDAVEIRYLTPGVAEVSLPVASTPDPFDSGGGGGGGGTTGGGWAEVAVPSVTPAGQVVLLVRGESWSITDLSQSNRTVTTVADVALTSGVAPPLFGSDTAITLSFSAWPDSPSIYAASYTQVISDGDFCAEIFVHIPGNTFNTVTLFKFIQQNNNSIEDISIVFHEANSQVSMYYPGHGWSQSATTPLLVDKWRHVVFSRFNGILYFHVNGEIVMQRSYPLMQIDFTGVKIGGLWSPAPVGVNANLKYARITTGDSVYSGASFPPLTSGY